MEKYKIDIELIFMNTLTIEANSVGEAQLMAENYASSTYQVTDGKNLFEFDIINSFEV